MPRKLFDSSRDRRLIAILLIMAVIPARASSIDILVVDPQGNPVPEVAVYVMQESVAARPSPGTAIMGQRDARFVPHILVVQQGTSVEFPNSDVVAHHVYSFSKPNHFVLPLYKGDPHKPVKFEHDGIVTLGCNIHDHMLAYIVVVGTDVFGITDENGRLTVDVDGSSTEFSVNIWSPRIRDKNLSQSLTAASSSATFSLRKKLRPHHHDSSESVHWSEY